MAKASVQGRLNRETNPIPGEIPGFNPQFIDDDGYATDVTPSTPFPSGNYVQTEGGVWVPQKGTDNGEAFVQLTGRKVIKEQVFSRSIRAEDSSFGIVTVPDGAIGLDFSVSIEGVTGSFASGEGLGIEVAFRYDDWSPTSWIHSHIRTQRTTKPGGHTILIYPGADTQKSNIEELEPSERRLKIASIPLVQKVRFQIRITGTFGQDEGFDCLGHVTWLY